MTKKQLDEYYEEFQKLIPFGANYEIVSKATKVKIPSQSLNARSGTEIFYKWLRKKLK